MHDATFYDPHKLWLIGLVVVLIMMLITSILWNIWREIAFRKVGDDSSRELKEILSSINKVTTKMDGAEKSDENQQRELRDMLNSLQTRIIEMIKMLWESSHGHTPMHIHNSNASNSDESRHDTVCDIEGGQNNVGSNAIGGGQNNAQ